MLETLSQHARAVPPALRLNEERRLQRESYDYLRESKISADTQRLADTRRTFSTLWRSCERRCDLI